MVCVSGWERDEYGKVFTMLCGSMSLVFGNVLGTNERKTVEYIGRSCNEGIVLWLERGRGDDYGIKLDELRRITGRVEIREENKTKSNKTKKGNKSTRKLRIRST